MQTPCSSGAEHTVNKNIIVPLGCLPSEVPANCPFSPMSSLWRGFLVLKTRNIYRQHSMIIYTHYTHITHSHLSMQRYGMHTIPREVYAHHPPHTYIRIYLCNHQKKSMESPSRPKKGLDNPAGIKLCLYCCLEPVTLQPDFNPGLLPYPSPPLSHSLTLRVSSSDVT